MLLLENENRKKSTKKKKADKIHAEAAENIDKLSNKPSDYDIPKVILEKLESEGIKELFEIQYSSFDLATAGTDIVGKAYTGSGKTLAFVLPTLSHLINKKIKTKRGEGTSVLCLVPTRELCIQVAKVFRTYAIGLSVCDIYGGGGHASFDRQLRQLNAGTDVVVGTCGRVKDLIERKMLKLDRCKFVILDEADEMLNIGFAEDVETILSNLDRDNNEIQTLLFSATIPEWINSIIDKYMKENRNLIDLVGKGTRQANKDVEHMALCCHPREREEVLADILLIHVRSGARVMIFSETKADCNTLAVSEFIKQECQVLHGDIVQRQREITTDGFRQGRFPVLICTDVAARGLDIDNVELIIQLKPPGDGETYIHRSGRTGRAGKKGKAIMFYAPRDRSRVKAVERVMGQKFKRIGAPQPEQLAAKCAEDSALQIKEMDTKITDIFSPLVDEYLNEMDPKIALANAFALISGYTKDSKKRSVLSGSKNFVTIQCNVKEECRSPGYIFQQIEKYFGWDLRQNIRGCTLLETKLGAVFDCPSENVKEVLACKKPYISFELVKEIPALTFDETRVSSRGSWGRGGGRGVGKRSSRGSWGRGRGRSSRGRGSWGRGGGSSWGRGGSFRSRGRGRGGRGRGGGGWGRRGGGSSYY